MRTSTLLFAAVLSLATSNVPEGSSKPEPSALPTWTYLSLSGHKLGQTARISVRASLVPGDVAAGSWLPTDAPAQRRPTGPSVLLLESLTAVSGRVFDEKAWLDATTSAAFQISDVETGAKLHRRLYRMLDRGFVFEERLPANAAQEQLPPEQWQKATRASDVFPPTLPPDAVVTGALALLCGQSIGKLRSPGDSVRHFIFVQKQLEEVTLTVEGSSLVPATFVEERAGRSGLIAGERQALAIRISNRPLDPQADGAFRLFGMSDGVRVLWDQRLGVPIEVSGRIHLVGELTIALDKVTLR